MGIIRHPRCTEDKIFDLQRPWERSALGSRFGIGSIELARAITRKIVPTGGN
jgi:hypothetical protein